MIPDSEVITVYLKDYRKHAGMVHNHLMRHFPAYTVMERTMVPEVEVCPGDAYSVTAHNSIHLKVCELVEDCLEGFPSVITGNRTTAWPHNYNAEED